MVSGFSYSLGVVSGDVLANADQCCTSIFWGEICVRRFFFEYVLCFMFLCIFLFPDFLHFRSHQDRRNLPRRRARCCHGQVGRYDVVPWDEDLLKAMFHGLYQGKSPVNLSLNHHLGRYGFHDFPSSKSANPRKGTVSFDLAPEVTHALLNSIAPPALTIPKSKKTTNTEIERRHPRPSLKVERYERNPLNF